MYHTDSHAIGACFCQVFEALLFVFCYRHVVQGTGLQTCPRAECASSFLSSLFCINTFFFMSGTVRLNSSFVWLTSLCPYASLACNGHGWHTLCCINLRHVHDFLLETVSCLCKVCGCKVLILLRTATGVSGLHSWVDMILLSWNKSP